MDKGRRLSTRPVERAQLESKSRELQLDVVSADRQPVAPSQKAPPENPQDCATLSVAVSCPCSEEDFEVSSRYCTHPIWGSEHGESYVFSQFP